MRSLKNIFTERSPYIIDITLYIVVFYANILFLYLAKIYDSMLFSVDHVIFVMVITFLIMHLIRKIFDFRNAILVGIYPVDLKNFFKMVYIQTYLHVATIFIMFSIPNIIFHTLNTKCVVVLWLVCNIDLNIGIMLYSFVKQRKHKESNLRLYGLLYYIISAEMLLYLIQWFGEHEGEQSIVLCISCAVYLFTIQIFRIKFDKILKAIYLVENHQKDKNGLADTMVTISSRIFKNHFWCQRELKCIVESSEFKELLVRTFVIVGVVTFYIMSNSYDVKLIPDVTTIMCAMNFYAPQSYYREQYIYETSEVMPISEKKLIMSKTVVNGMIWFVFTMLVVIISAISMGGFSLWYIIFCISSFFIWSYAGVYIDKKNNYRYENNKNKYSRIIVIIMAVIYISLQKELINMAGINTNQLPIFYCVMNIMLSIIIIWRIQNDNYN